MNLFQKNQRIDSLVIFSIQNGDEALRPFPSAYLPDDLTSSTMPPPQP